MKGDPYLWELVRIKDGNFLLKDFCDELFFTSIYRYGLYINKYVILKL